MSDEPKVTQLTLAGHLATRAALFAPYHVPDVVLEFSYKTAEKTVYSAENIACNCLMPHTQQHYLAFEMATEIVRLRNKLKELGHAS